MVICELINVVIFLRNILDSDFEVFFENQLDEEANYMASFTAKDPTYRLVFDEHWNKILADDKVILKTIIYDGEIAGSIAKFVQFDNSEVSYWIGRKYWGKNIATNSLELFLKELKERPLYARTAKDNFGSIRVLEKCGFTNVGEDKGYSNARQKDVEEFIFKLE